VSNLIEEKYNKHLEEDKNLTAEELDAKINA